MTGSNKVKLSLDKGQRERQGFASEDYHLLAFRGFSDSGMLQFQGGAAPGELCRPVSDSISSAPCGEIEKHSLPSGAAASGKTADTRRTHRSCPIEQSKHTHRVGIRKAGSRSHWPLAGRILPDACGSRVLRWRRLGFEYQGQQQSFGA